MSRTKDEGADATPMADANAVRAERRAFLTGAGTLAAGATLAATASVTQADSARLATNTEAVPAAAPAIRRGKQRLRFAVPWRDTVAGLGDNAHRLAQRIALASDHAVDVDIVFEVGPRATGDGGTTELEADLWIDAGDTTERPACDLFYAGLPGRRAMDATTLHMWVSAGGGQQLWDDALGERDIKPLLIAHLGPQPGLICRAALSGPEDFIGKTFGGVGAVTDVIEGLGGRAPDLDPQQFNTAFATNRLDGVSWLGAYLAHAENHFAAATHLIDAGIAPHGQTLALRIKRPVWERLDDATQAMVTAAAHEEYSVTVAETRMHHAILRGRLATHDGISIVPVSPAFAAAIDRVADAVVAEHTAQSRSVAHIHASYTAFRDQACALSPVPPTPSV